MRRLRPAALVIPLVVLWVAAIGPVHGQTPTPTLASCQGASVDGGGPYSFGPIEVTLPPGTYAVSISPPGPAPTFTICQAETGAVVELGANDCGEVSRVAPTADAKAVADTIVSSCRAVPPPTLQPPPLLCPEGDPVNGGQTVTIADSIEVTLPTGDFMVAVSNEVAQICNPLEQYMLALRLSDCTRPDIIPPNAPAQDIMNQIVASCVLLHPATPAPTAPTLIEPGIITPPSTGDAGLKGAGTKTEA